MSSKQGAEDKEHKEQRAEHRAQSTMQAGSTENRAENRSREQEQEAGSQRREHRATSSMSEVNKLLFNGRRCARLLKVNMIHVTFESRAGFILLVHFFAPSKSCQKDFCG